ncbi:restriction endonuclease [Bacillus sp. SRB_336]|nr:restriction endonuclease [Bacillus sp. SRB_336]
MAQRTKSGFEQIAAMPWWLGILIGLLGYIAIRHGIGWYFGAVGNPYTAGLGKLAASGIYAPLAWILLIGCWIAALASFIGRGRRRQLLDRQTGLDSLRRMSWRQFEQLAGEAFRRQGYAIEETGLGGADGGIDLILRRNGQTTLVQCKQWQNRQVGVKVVREMYGLLMHHQAAAVKIIALGNYTPDAHRFAHGKPIELIHGGELIATVRSLQKDKARATSPMDTPLAFAGGFLASLLLIAALSSPTVSTSSPVVSAPVATQAINQSESPLPHRLSTVSTTRLSAIHASESQKAADLRERKKQNTEASRFLEKIKEVPLR